MTTRVYGHFVIHNAVPMTKAEIIRRREEAIRMTITYLELFDDHALWSEARRAGIVASGRQMGKQAMTRIFLEGVTK